MLVNMFGAPSSGKSTIAANVFARLKTDGIPAEFISERAREVIAKFKFKKIKTMSDEMQLEILEAQYHAETYFKHSTDYPVIADSSTLLTLAYGTESFFQKYGDRVQQLVQKYECCIWLNPAVLDHLPAILILSQRHSLAACSV